MKLLSAPLSLFLFCSSIVAEHASVLSHTSVLDMVEDVNVRPKLDKNDQQIQYVDNNKCIRKGNRMSATMYDISTESCRRVEDGWDFKSIEGETYVIKLKGTELCLGGSSDKVILSECADPPRSQSQTWKILSEDDTRSVRFLNKVAKKCMKLNKWNDIFMLVECNLVRDQLFNLDNKSQTKEPEMALIKTRKTQECMYPDRLNVKEVMVGLCLTSEPAWFHWYNKFVSKVDGWMIVHKNTKLCLTVTTGNTVSTAPCDRKRNNQYWDISTDQLRSTKVDKCMSLGLAAKKFNLVECKSTAERQFFDFDLIDGLSVVFMTSATTW